MFYVFERERGEGVSVVSLYRIQRAPEDVVGVVYRSAAEKQSTYSNHPQRVKDENSPAGRPFMCVCVCIYTQTVLPLNFSGFKIFLANMWEWCI